MKSKPEKYKKLDYGTFDNIKLIIGNGFDLACGLHSSYGDFFRHSTHLYEEIKSWIDKGSVFPEEATAWDLYFYLLSEHSDIENLDKIDWKDVETYIYEAVRPNGNFHFTFDSLGNHKNSEQELLNRLFIEHSIDILDKHKSYQFLYDELIRFEKRFTDFLLPQQEDVIYNKNVEKMLTKEGLLKFRTSGSNSTLKKARKYLISIDTFNYTTPKYFDEIKGVEVNHINGKIGDAIFGIDKSVISVNDEAYIFTKVNRKIGTDANGKYKELIGDYHNIVIFGHSFSKSDYSYFYSILNNLNPYRYNAYGKRIIIAFSDYHKNSKDNSEALEKLYASFIKLIDCYDSYSKPNAKNKVALETMVQADRLGFYKLDSSLLL